MNRRNFMIGGIVAGMMCVFPSLAQTNDFDLKQIERDISEILMNYVFEGNDPITRRDISLELNEYLSGKSGLRNYDVVSNGQNNTSKTHDEYVKVEVYLLPNKDVITHLEYRVYVGHVVLIYHNSI